MPKYQLQISPKALEISKGLDLIQCLRQICCPHYFPQDTDFQAAGAVFFHPNTQEKLRSNIDKFKKLCPIPPLVTTDMENGPGDMIFGTTKFPMFMGCALDVNEKYLEDIGKCAALEGREVGFNSTLGPCVDIFANPDSPAVGLRSAGSTVEKVVRAASSYIKGLQSNGMAATIKHFPGDGSCLYDQHLTTPENRSTWENWQAGPGRVYRELIQAGTQWVMPGHISLPCYDDLDAQMGMYPPATLSKKLMVDLLRGELGFQGLIISDAVEMGGFAGFCNIYDAMVRFWENGGDILLFPRLDKVFFSEMQKRLDSGMLREATLRNRATRVIAFKEQQGLFNETTSSFSLNPQQKQKFNQLSVAVIENSVVIKRDRHKILPLSPSKFKKVAHLILEVNQGKASSTLQKLTERLKMTYEQVIVWGDEGADVHFDKIQNGEVEAVICSVSAPYRFGTNVTRFHGVVARNLMKGWMKLGIPVVFISHDSVTFAEEYRHFDTVIATHGLSVESFPCLIHHIAGQKEEVLC